MKFNFFKNKYRSQFQDSLQYFTLVIWMHGRPAIISYNSDTELKTC